MTYPVERASVASSSARAIVRPGEGASPPAGPRSRVSVPLPLSGEHAGGPGPTAVDEDAPGSSQAAPGGAITPDFEGQGRSYLEGVSAVDGLWRRAYRYARAVFWRSDLGKLPSNRPTGSTNERAQLVADYVVWKLHPDSKRPAEWPRTEEGLAHLHGATQLELRRLIGRRRDGLAAKLMGQASELWDVEERLDELIEATITAAFEALRDPEGRKNADRLVRVACEYHGKLQRGGGGGISIVNMNLPGTSAEDREARAELEAMIRRVYEFEQHRLPAREVPVTVLEPAREVREVGDGSGEAAGSGDERSG